MGVLLVLWGSFAAVARLALGSADSFQVQFYLYGFGIVIMTVWAFVKKKSKEFRKVSRKKPFN
jgi:hypothetical protein